MFFRCYGPGQENCSVLIAAEESAKAEWVRHATLHPYILFLFEGWKLWPYFGARYEKLLRYCSNEFRQIGRDFQLEVSKGLQEAVVHLRKLNSWRWFFLYLSPHFSIYEPLNIQWGLTFLSEMRQATVLLSSIAALTPGYPRPIELRAQDRLRYMPAWVYQFIAAKREFLESLSDWTVMDRWLEVLESLALNMRKTGYPSLWVWLLESYVCLWRYPLFLFFFLLIWL